MRILGVSQNAHNHMTSNKCVIISSDLKYLNSDMRYFVKEEVKQWSLDGKASLEAFLLNRLVDMNVSHKMNVLLFINIF